MFTQEFLEELNSRILIEEVMREFISFTKKGDKLVALCPFHSEKTASFQVSTSKGVYYCFGCGKGGNSYTFLRDYYGLQFTESVIYLAEKFGVPLPKLNEKDKELASISGRIHEMNHIALAHWTLDNISTEYLKGRGFSDKTIEFFKLGYAAGGLLEKLEKQFTLEDVKTGGLIKETDNRYYDTFRNRIMIPIHNTFGKLIGFGGRDLNPNSEIKYLNSQETPLFQKRRNLYALYENRDRIKSKGFAILTEGYFDVISLYDKGVKNAVANLGTSLTEEQSILLKRFSDKIVICYDGDHAGRNASLRAIKHLLPNDFSIKVCVLPDNKDPDQFVKENGGRAFEEYRANAKSWIDFVIEETGKQFDMSVPQAKSAYCSQALSYLTSINNLIERRDYFEYLVKKLELHESIHDELWQSVLVKEKAPFKIRSITEEPFLVEKELIRLLVSNEDARISFLERDISHLQEFKTFPILEKMSLDVEFSEVIEAIPDELKDIFSEAYMCEDMQQGNLNSYLSTMSIIEMENKCSKITEEIKSCKDVEKGMDLLKNKMQLVKEIRALRDSLQENHSH